MFLIKKELLFTGLQERKYNLTKNRADLQYLVQEVGAMAGQTSTVIHYSWDVPVERQRSHLAWMLKTTHLKTVLLNI